MRVNYTREPSVIFPSIPPNGGVAPAASAEVLDLATKRLPGTASEANAAVLDSAAKGSRGTSHVGH